jgi:peptide/nickel transport system substrate-binding protein
MRFVALCSLAAALVLAGASTGGAARHDATRSAAPFAQAWANVPASPAARRARNVVVFGTGGTISGFNTRLVCCNEIIAEFIGANEALHGAFNQNDRGVWFKDLVSSASADRRGVSYTIKPNAYWYWGGRKVAVTYRDFVYTLQQLDDPPNDVADRTGYSQLDPTNFVHTGERHVTFFWKTTNCSADFPCGPFANWQLLFSTLYPSFALRGLDFNKIWTNCICGSDGKPVSDGPFYLSNYTAGEGATLKANPYFYSRAKVAEVDFKIIQDDGALEQATLGGQVDAVAPRFTSIWLPLKSARGITFDQVPGYVFEHLELREGGAKAGPSVDKAASNALLRAPWMREAIMLGIDRRRIIKAVFGPLAGNIKPLDNIVVYSTESGYRPDFRRWDYNPEKAVALLKRHCVAGSGPSAPSAGNTRIWQCAGLPATFNWEWGAGREDWTVSEQVAKAELKSIGIALNDRPFPVNAIFGAGGVPSGDFDIVQFRNITTGDPGETYEAYRCYGAANWTGYCSHKVDSLLKAANAELDPEKRGLLFQQADAIMATQVPVIPMYQVPVILIHRSNLLGMRQNPGIGGPVWNIQDWHWRS